MRPIKFRAWDKEEKKFIKPESNICLSLSGEVCEPGDGNLLLHDNFPILMQFTGLKDKNGVEIFEGDLLKGEEGKYEVVYEAPEFQVKHSGYRNLDPFYRKLDSDGIYEVIGNIHENPELLEK